MRSDVVKIDNQGNGFADALAETEKIAGEVGLDQKQTLHLRLMAEEMLSLVQSVTGEMEASYWIENEGKNFVLSMTTNTVMDRKTREMLISSSSTRKNAAADSLLGRLRDAFERAMAAEPLEAGADDVPREMAADVSMLYVEDLEWDGYERSVLRSVADDVKVGVRKDKVYLTVTKQFA